MTFRRPGNVRRRHTVVRVGTGTMQGVSLLQPETTATFNSVHVYVPYVEQGGAMGATAQLEYKKTADSTYLPGLPLQGAESTAWGSRLSGAVLMCDPDTSYDLRVTVTGGGGTEVLNLQQRTWAEDVESHASLLARATHYVRLDGSDSNAGTADNAGGAWRTIRKAELAAPDGAVVVVGSGTADEYFDDCGATSTNPLRQTQGGISFVARFPALDDARASTNVGKRTFVEGHIRAAKTGATIPGAPTAPWTQEVLTGPLTGDQVTVWKWAGAIPNAERVNALSYGANRTDEYRAMWHWDWQVATDWTPAHWAEFAQGGPNALQQSWHYGFFYVSGGADLYLLMPPDAAGNPQDPNAFFWCANGGDGFSLACPDSRVAGFVIRGNQNAVYGNQRADRLIVDHCWLQSNYSGVRTQGIPSQTGGYSSDAVVQYNLMTMRGLRRQAGLTQLQDPACPWGWVKQYTFLTPRGVQYVPVGLQLVQVGGPNDGKTLYTRKRLGGRMEGTGMLNTGSRRTVFRHNTVDGLFNGFGAEIVGNSTQFTEHPHANSESDCHDNLFKHLPDDAWEPSHGCSNVKFWRNRVEYCISGMSTGGPTAWGPLSMWDNVFWRVSCSGVVVVTAGPGAPYTVDFGMQTLEDGANSLSRGDQNAYWFKYDGAASSVLPQARFYVFNNVYWSDDPRAHGGEPAAGAGNTGQRFTKRNNIDRVAVDFMDFFGGNTAAGVAKGGWDEDYDHQAAANPAARFRRNGATAADVVAIYASLAAYQAGNPGQGVHSNTANADWYDVAWLDAQFTDPKNGDLTLVPGSPLRGIGVNVANICPTGSVNLGAVTP